MDSFDREQYLQQLREYYSGDRDRIDQFLEDMSDSLDCYLKEHPAADASEIYARFGDPEELKKQQELVRSESHTQRKRNVIRIAVAAICAVSILALGIFVRPGWEQIINSKGYTVLEEQESEEDQPLPDPIETPSSTPVFYLNE